MNDTLKIPEEPMRKASQVLVELEEKVDKLTAIVNLYDFNIKNILKKVNETYILVAQILNSMPLSDGQKQQVQAQLNPLRHPEAIEIPKGAPVEVETEPQGHRRTSRAETYTGEQNTFTGFKEYAAETNKAAPQSDRKIPVIQKIKFSDGKDVFNASVSFFQGDKLIYKGFSNAIGKAQAQLVPGKYSVHIVKVEASTKRKYETTQTIEVPSNANNIVELPTCVIQK